MRYFVRTGLVTGLIAAVLAVGAVSWAEYSARSSCAGAGSATTPMHAVAKAGSATLIDEVMPWYHIGEKHSIFIRATPDRVFEAFERAGNYERPVVKVFNNLPAMVGNGESPSSKGMPMYEELRSGSGLVLVAPGREVVAADIATTEGRAAFAPGTAREFGAYRLGRNEMKGAVNLHVDPVDSGSRLTTETRVAYGDRASCRSFGRYWGAIYPGSSLYRIELLKTIKRRVESGETAASSPDVRNGASYDPNRSRDASRSGAESPPLSRGRRRS